MSTIALPVLCTGELKLRNRTGPKTDPWGTPDKGLDLRLGHLTPLIESAQRAMKGSTCE